jgi:8-oxo-dGTP diphosphatase / 2-hydroxy-dATP diphosphatase
MRKKLLTLCIIHQGDSVLLGMKKRGFGKGRWNGFGGKVGADETIQEATARELQEEAGITPLQLYKLGILEFEFRGDPQILEVHIFKCESYTGEVGESEEMRPQWFGTHEVPFEEMWKDDIFWFEYFLQNKKFQGRFVFDEHDEILDMNVGEVEDLA